MERSSILIVDDELGPRESLRMILKPSYQVYTAEHGMAALQFLQRRSVDLITLDLKMPGLSGTEVLEQIRKSNPDVMVIIVTGYGTFKSVVEAIRFNVFDYISKPFNVPEILSVVKRCLEMANTTRVIKSIFKEIACLSEGDPSGSHQVKIAEKIRKHFCDSANPGVDTENMKSLDCIRLMSRCIEKRDPYTIGHSESVSGHTDLMALQLGLSDSVRTELQIASCLHDIGKVCISSRFMNQEGKLSSADWAILKRHPIKSLELIAPLKLSTDVISAIYHHHERFDGTGYPDGLSGNDIPLGARVIAFGNVYDSLTSRRSDRKAMSPSETKAEIRRGAGSLFDPDLTPLFLEVLKKQKNFSRQEGSQERLQKEALR